MDEKNIGKKIKQRREKKKISQEKLAHAINVTQGTICNWESGRHAIPFPKAIEISTHLEINITDLYEKVNVEIV